jgi:excisionase family DNA binding protein
MSAQAACKKAATPRSSARREVEKPSREIPHTSELLLTVEQAARKLNIGKSLMYKLIWDGDVTSIMIGRFRRVSVAELERYIEAGMLAERMMSRMGRSA